MTLIKKIPKKYIFVISNIIGSSHFAEIINHKKIRVTIHIAKQTICKTLVCTLRKRCIYEYLVSLTTHLLIIDTR